MCVTGAVTSITHWSIVIILILIVALYRYIGNDKPYKEIRQVLNCFNTFRKNHIK